MSPRLKLVVDGIFGVVPEFKGWFCQPRPRQIVWRDLQMLRKNSEQLDLIFHVQVVNGCADFHYSAHKETITPVESKSKLRTVAQARLMAEANQVLLDWGNLWRVVLGCAISFTDALFLAVHIDHDCRGGNCRDQFGGGLERSGRVAIGESWIENITRYAGHSQ